jgi:hypothetical protein
MIGCMFSGERHNLWDVYKRDFISDLFCFFGIAGLLFSDFCASTHPPLALSANSILALGQLQRHNTVLSSLGNVSPGVLCLANITCVVFGLQKD